VKEGWAGDWRKEGRVEGREEVGLGRGWEEGG